MVFAGGGEEEEKIKGIFCTIIYFLKDNLMDYT
jgi:hypothetical protein